MSQNLDLSLQVHQCDKFEKEKQEKEEYLEMIKDRKAFIQLTTVLNSGSSTEPDASPK